MIDDSKFDWETETPVPFAAGKKAGIAEERKRLLPVLRSALSLLEVLMGGVAHYGNSASIMQDLRDAILGTKVGVGSFQKLCSRPMGRFASFGSSSGSSRMKKSLADKIEKFLANRRKSTGGWAEVRVQDVNGLEAIIRELIKLKFEKDPDGDLPIEFKVIDRTWFEPMHFQPVPYLGIARCVDLTEDQKQDILDQHVLNLDIAHERFRNAHRILSHERRRMKEK